MRKTTNKFIKQNFLTLAPGVNIIKSRTIDNRPFCRIIIFLNLIKSKNKINVKQTVLRCFDFFAVFSHFFSVVFSAFTFFLYLFSISQELLPFSHILFYGHELHHLAILQYYNLMAKWRFYDFL